MLNEKNMAKFVAKKYILSNCVDNEVDRHLLRPPIIVMLEKSQ